jgi:hypothetical protein
MSIKALLKSSYYILWEAALVLDIVFANRAIYRATLLHPLFNPAGTL